MRDIRVKASVLVGVVISVMAAVAYYVVLPRVSVPPPDVHSYFIFPGSVSRAIVQEKDMPRRSHGRRGGLRRTHLPHHLGFDAPGGAAVYVMRYPTGTSRQQVDEMTRLTDELRAGRPPATVVAKGSGTSGR